ncbi:MAG: hypothetical protein HPY62_06485 [Bacteroidales bacterium]|nr:hypothetical protein [Bacteroidales bacterium]
MLFLLSHASSGIDRFSFTAGAAEAGTGYTCISKTGFWSSFQNQAILAYNKSIRAGVNYENRFSLKETGIRSAGIIFPVNNTSIAGVFSHSGYSDFSRSFAGLACGLMLSEKISAGVQIDYFIERMAGEYRNNQYVSFETGVLITVTDNISAGIQLFNPVPNSLRKTGIPSRLRAGAGIKMNQSLFTGIEAELSTGKKLNIKTGFEYEFAGNLFLRGGFSTESSSFSFGLGYLLKSVMTDVSFSTHECLGITSSVSLIFIIH